MKKFDKNEALARFSVKWLTSLGWKCTTDDIAAMCHEENPSWKQMGVRIDDNPIFVYQRVVSIWLNGTIAIFNGESFREWAKANPPNRQVRGSDLIQPYMPNPNKAAAHVFNYYNVSRLERAGEECGLLLIGPVTMDEIMATMKETEHDRQIS